MMNLTPHACKCRSRKAFRCATRRITSTTEFTGRSSQSRENSKAGRSVARRAVAPSVVPNKGTASHAAHIRAEGQGDDKAQSSSFVERRTVQALTEISNSRVQFESCSLIVVHSAKLRSKRDPWNRQVDAATCSRL